jgi:hypothetical protein
MATLTNIDKLKLEKIIQSYRGAGYVLDFSDRALQDFVQGAVQKDILTEKYAHRGTSKANRLRVFLDTEDNMCVGSLIQDLLVYWKGQKVLNSETITQSEQQIYQECELIAKRLLGQPIHDMKYEFDVAISFAGEDRDIADEIATKLKASGVRVFYDKFEEVDLWGKDLYEHLDDIYSKKARFCVMLLSEYYAKKAWTNHERKSAQERAFKESEAYILPVKLDDTSIPGIRDTVGYMSLRNKSVDDVVVALLQKLKMTDVTTASTTEPVVRTYVASKPAIPLPKIQKTFTERDRDIFIDASFETIRSYFLEGIKQLNRMQDTEADFKEITTNKFMCKVYVQGKKKASCTIWIGSQFSSGGINYSNEANPDAGSSLNDSLTVEVGNTDLSLKTLMGGFSSNQKTKLTSAEAAEYYWFRLIAGLENRVF